MWSIDLPGKLWWLARFFKCELQTVKTHSEFIRKIVSVSGKFQANWPKKTLLWISHIRLQGLTVLYPISCYNGPQYNRGLLYQYFHYYQIISDSFIFAASYLKLYYKYVFHNSYWFFFHDDYYLISIMGTLNKSVIGCCLHKLMLQVLWIWIKFPFSPDIAKRPSSPVWH